MRLFKKSIIVVLLCAFLLSVFSYIPFSAAYENTYKNTGDGAKDIVGVALTQLGYKEGSLEGTKQDYNDYTKYGKWYGTNYVPWCAIFVSWCANQAGIPTNVIPVHASCDNGMNWFKSKGRWQTSEYFGGDYVPSPGDIIYFGENPKDLNDSTHIGIVNYVNDRVVNVIEGNSAAKVQRVNYKLTSAYIFGYGTPAYSKTNDNLVPGTYVTTAELLNFRTQPSNTSRIITRLEKNTRLQITDFYGNWGKTTVNGEVGWVSLSYIDRVCFVSFNANGGKNTPSEIAKKPNEGVTIPKTVPTKSGYSFIGWSISADARIPDYQPGDTFISDMICELYAVWEPLNTNITVNSSKGGKVIISETNGIRTLYAKADKGNAVSYFSVNGEQQVLTGDTEAVIYFVNGSSSSNIVIRFADNPVMWVNPFDDVSEGSWYYSAVGYCYQSHFFSGTSQTAFSPSAAMQRKDVTIVLGKVYEALTGVKIPDSGETDFTDVKSNSYYGKYVAWANENGISTGISKTVFGINEKVSRAQILIMLRKLEILIGHDGSYDSNTADTITDITSSGKWALPGLYWAIGKEIITPSNNRVNPSETASRAQIAQMIYALYK